MLARTLQHQDNRTDVSGYYIHCLAHGGRLGYDEVECFLVWYGIYIYQWCIYVYVYVTET